MRSGRVIALVEDNADLRAVLRRNLERAGMSVVEAADGETGLATVREARPALVILDVMLPKLDGFRVLRALRNSGDDTPVLLLTARAAETDKVYGLRTGADDYLTKPFGIPELLARIEALLRRSTARTASPQSEVLVAGDIRVDLTRREVRRGGETIDLAPRVFELLVALARKNGAVATRDDLMREVWGYAESTSSRTLDAHVAELRRCIEEDPANPRRVRTVWRVGYRLDPEL